MLDSFHEKLVYGAAALVAGFLGWAGSILTEGEFRWLCITMTASILMACFVALIVKSPADTIKVTVGRAGLAIALGTCGTRELVIRWGIAAFEGDAVRLAGVAAGLTVAGMVIGYPLVLLANTRGPAIARAILRRLAGKVEKD